MLQTIEGILDQNGALRLLEPIKLSKRRRVIITFLNEDLSDEVPEPVLSPKPIFVENEVRSEADAAWFFLSQQGLAQAYGDDEPEYTTSMIIRANPDYDQSV